MDKYGSSASDAPAIVEGVVIGDVRHEERSALSVTYDGYYDAEAV